MDGIRETELDRRVGKGEHVNIGVLINRIIHVTETDFRCNIQRQQSYYQQSYFYLHSSYYSYNHTSTPV